MLRAAGFNGGQALVMTAISLLECQDCEMGSVNATGDVGLMQINRVHWGSSDPRTSVWGDLTDPAVSARAAFAVWSGAGGQSDPARGYRQWCTYPGGCGGASPISESTFNALLQNVVATIQGGENPPATGGDGSVTTPGPGQGGPDVTPGASSTQGCTFTPTDCTQVSGPKLSLPGGGGADFTVISQALCGAQNSLGLVGQFFCNLGTILSYFTIRGHWWQIAFIGAGAVLVLVGVTTYLNPNVGSALVKGAL